MPTIASKPDEHAVDLVLSFLASWNGSREEVGAAMFRFLSSEIVWDNVGYARTVGLHQAPVAFSDFELRFPFARMSVDVLKIAASGASVFSERIDHFHDAKGAIGLSVPVSGVMDVVDGRIVAWRDYCDFQLFRNYPVAPPRAGTDL